VGNGMGATGLINITNPALRREDKDRDSSVTARRQDSMRRQYTEDRGGQRHRGQVQGMSGKQLRMRVSEAAVRAAQHVKITLARAA